MNKTRIVKLFAIIAAIAFVISKIFLYYDPELSDMANDPLGSLVFSLGFIIGAMILVLPFIVAYIRDSIYKWWILVSIFAVPFIAGFYVGLSGGGDEGLSVVNSLIVPIAWILALVSAIFSKKQFS